MSDSRLEKFIYAICSMDVSDLPVPLSRIETLWNCLITGETPDFEPLSRNEKYLMAMLDRYDISNLPAPMSRGEKLLYKIVVGETDLSDVPGYLSRYEELLKYLIENGGISGGDFEYVLYTLNQSLYTLYTTAEKPVKSAILKGQTLVNLVGEKRNYDKGGLTNLYGWEFMLPYNLVSGKTYLAVFNATGTINDTNAKVYLMNNGFNSDTGNQNPADFKIGHNRLKCIASTDNHRVLRIRTGGQTTKDLEVSDVMLIPYQEGMENWDIPYFEGMQSVKMPVLTTTGKNLFDENKEKSQYYITSNGKYAEDEHGYQYINQEYKVNGGETFSISFEARIGNNAYIRIAEFKGDNFIKRTLISSKKTLTVDIETNRIIFSVDANTDRSFTHLQIEQSTQATSYEPFKSNILTVNEDVELRCVGDVRDELNLLTGELTQRVGELTYDGSENWKISVYDTYHVFYITRGEYEKDLPRGSKLVCNQYNYNGEIYNDRHIIAGNNFALQIRREDMITLDEFKAELQVHNLKVVHQLATESVKTVDLTVVDQDNQPTQLGTFENVTHVSLEAENLIPEVEMEVATNLLEDTVFNLTNAFNTLYPTAEKPVVDGTLYGRTLLEGAKLISCKMPVLTTMGESIINGMIKKNQFVNKSNGVVYNTKGYARTAKIPIKKGKEYFIKFNDKDFDDAFINIIEYGDDYLRGITFYSGSVYKPSSDCNFIQVSTSRLTTESLTDEILENFQLIITDKSNILTVNEPVELRGIGDVRDTLDLLTGEVTKRIGEIVLDGGEDWSVWKPLGLGGDIFGVVFLPAIEGEYGEFLCDKLPAIIDGYVGLNTEFIYFAPSGRIALGLNKNSITSISDVIDRLSKNPLIVQYQLATESIKTVDLSVVDQDGNVTTLKTFDDTTHVLLNSEGLIPTAALTVRTKIPSASSTSLLMDDISTNQQQLEVTVDEQSNNVDATMIATTEIFEETL